MSGTSTMHWRQAPCGSSSGWSQKRGIATPMRSAARITSVPLGTLTSTPSMVSVTRSIGLLDRGVLGGDAHAWAPVVSGTENSALASYGNSSHAGVL